MPRGNESSWPTSVTAAAVALLGALLPLVASAQNAPASGATVAVGGVQTQAPQVSGAQARTPEVAGTGLAAAPVEVQGVQAQPVEARPLVLPNTGGGPAADDRPGLLILAGLTALVAGAFVRLRAWRSRSGA